MGDIAPAAGDDLIFHQGPSSLISNNDLAAGIAYGSLTIADTGYSITGNAASFTSIDASQTSGSSEVDLPIALVGGSQCRQSRGEFDARWRDLGLGWPHQERPGYARSDGRQYVHGNDSDQRGHCFRSTALRGAAR